jgi:hypothetical protein
MLLNAGIVAAGGGVAPETTTLLAAFTGTYDTARQAAINDLIVALKSDGIWAKLDVMCIAGLTESDSLVNWKTPGTFNGTAVNSPTFTADRGFTFNGSTNYVNTNFTPSTAVGIYALNSAHISVYSRTNSALAQTEMGANATVGLGNCYIAARFSDGNCYYGLNSNGSSFVSSSSSQLLLANRSGATSVQFYRSGVSMHTTSSDSSVALPDRPIWVGARNSDTIFQQSTKQIAAWSVGGSLSSTDAANFSTALTTYLTSLGANV